MPFTYDIPIVYVHCRRRFHCFCTGFVRAGCLQCVFLSDSNNNNNNNTQSILSTSPAIVVSEYTATCLIPSQGVGATSVLISSCQGQGLGLGLGPGTGSISTSSLGPLLDSQQGFVFPLKVVSPPVLSSVSPPSGSTQGGYVVTMRGKGFTTEMDVLCSFGNNN